MSHNYKMDFKVISVHTFNKTIIINSNFTILFGPPSTLQLNDLQTKLHVLRKRGVNSSAKFNVSFDFKRPEKEMEQVYRSLQ